MADEVKISELPAVSTPAGTDQFAVEQSGTTKRATLAQMLAAGVAGSFSTGAFSGDVSMGSNTLAASIALKLNALAGNQRQINFQSGGVNRWVEYADNTAEGGSNAGSDKQFNAYDDSGVLIGTALKLTRATLFALFGGDLSVKATKKIHLDEGGNTYLVESSADVFDIVVGGVTAIRITEASDIADITLPQVNDAVTPTLNFGDGDSGVYEESDDILVWALGATGRWKLDGDLLKAFVSGGPHIANEVPSATNAVFVPNDTDPDSGVGWNSADNPCLVAGGLEAIRAEDPADLVAGETSLWLYDDDNGQMEQVTVGAADSGGSGYKVLRIPN